MQKVLPSKYTIDVRLLGFETKMIEGNYVRENILSLGSGPVNFDLPVSTEFLEENILDLVKGTKLRLEVSLVS